MNVKKGDKVQVLSGKDKGATGEVLRAFPSEGKVIVEGVAMVKRHQRPTQANQQGGILEREAAIDVSNVPNSSEKEGSLGAVYPFGGTP
jgi:large subunit ribosomal protein L24